MASRESARPAAEKKPTLAASSGKPQIPSGQQRPPAPDPKSVIQVPPILFEGDSPAPVPAESGPGSRYALGQTPPRERFRGADDLGELPEAYGTQRLLLTARDPHWLYASWDLTRAQVQQYNRASAEGHLILRIFSNAIGDKVLSEVHVHPESRNWFVHVPESGARYAAELGYRDGQGRWHTVSKSKATVTPPDSLAEEGAVQFATIPADVPLESLMEMVKEAIAHHLPLSEAVEQLRTEGHPKLPKTPAQTPQAWTPAQSRALADVISMDRLRRVWMGSLEITELIRRHLQQELFSAVTGEYSAPGLGGESAGEMGGISSAAISSPHKRLRQRKGFWFNINAELVVYGATEPSATVTIGGKSIKLRPDGSFSFRFALPDGQYELPTVAISADETDQRKAHLKFSRTTEYKGEVEKHPQDSALKTPAAANVA